ncbi:MAG: ArsR family transcriptional regulator [Planctomycetota bacterium]|nr:MAG: ArsR family transcriptional regulator [Planctomycetota bacterium]
MAAQEPCARKLKSLADPTRLGVLRALARGPQRVKTLGALLGTEQSLLSKHLRVLRDAGLVVARRDGKGVRYRLADGVAAAGGGLDLGCCRLSFDPEPRS